MIELSFYWSLLFSIASDVKRKVGQGAVPLSLGAKTKPWDGEPFSLIYGYLDGTVG